MTFEKKPTNSRDGDVTPQKHPLQNTVLKVPIRYPMANPSIDRTSCQPHMATKRPRMHETLSFLTQSSHKGPFVPLPASTWIRD
jgi:hypothetical protein